MFEEMSDDEFIGWLEDEGAFIIDGVDEDGELVMKMNPERMLELCPELYYALADDLSKSLEELYEHGLVGVEYDEDLTARFYITEEGKEIVEKYKKEGDF